MTGAGAMEVRALGPLEVLRNGDAVDLGPHKQRCLLVLLLIHANEVVSTERILEELWGEDSFGKENALWVYVSRLRSALEPDRTSRGESTVLLRRAPGYVLVVDPRACDLHRFADRAAEGRSLSARDPVRAAALLTEALALWRGEALEGFRYEPFAQTEIARLEEARASALEDRLDADLARGLAGELVSELEVLRREHPLRERPVGQLMLALYRSGRAADALRAFDRFRRGLGDELGIDPSPELRGLEEQILLHDPSLRRLPVAATVPLPGEEANPYKGLRPFGEDDADDFFGRDQLIAEMLRALGWDQRLIAVVGASGSGKSSAVRAGLVPAIRKGALPASEGWLIASMVPGAHPFAELEAALLRTTIDAPDGLAEQLADAEIGLLRAALRVLPNDSARLVLVIDQFEELFTLVADPEVRERFLTNLVTALDDPHGRVSVVLTLRADFYGQPLQHPQFGARLSGSVINVTTLSPEELEVAAVEPARRVGVATEPALVAQLIADLGTQPGALPLFQYTLTELFERRIGELMTVAAYREMGGVTGAVGRRASELYLDSSAEEQLAARQLFLRMIAVTEGDERIRRRVTAAEILSLNVDAAVMQEVIGRFTRHRLLAFDVDQLTGAPTIEVAHEALLGAWDTLQAWVDESRDDLRRHASLALAMREWELADRDRDYLLTGSRLAEHLDWTAHSAMTLTGKEQAFLDASTARYEEEETAEANRRRHEAGLKRQSRRRLGGLVAALVALAGVGTFLLWAALADSEPPTVAFFGSRDDEGWNANIAAGVDRAARDLDIELQEVRPLVEPAKNWVELAESHPDLVISDGLPAVLAPESFSVYDDVRFGVIDGFVDAPNTAVITFANEQGAFLVGAAAALKTETGVVGFVGGMRMDRLEEFRAGFEAGVRHIDPGIEVLATYVEEPFAGAVGFFVAPFFRPDLGRQRAAALYERGADVVFHAASESGFGVFEAAVELSGPLGRHLWAIGVDNDQWFQVDTTTQDHLLTSMVKRGDIAAYLLITQFLEGEFRAGVQELTLADDAMSFATSGDNLDRAQIARLQRLKADVAQGRIVVPTAPTGELLVLDPLPPGFDAAFADLPPDDIVAYFDDWLIVRFAADSEAACHGSGTVTTCGQLMLDHLDEWRATR